MNDETKDELMRRTREWLQSCVNAATRSGVPEEADLEAFILVHLDGEAARTAAAVAAAREEQREADAKFCPNCLGVGFVERPVPCPYCDDSTHDHYCPTGTQRQQCGCGAERIRATPLTATPLGDRLAAVENERDHLKASLVTERQWHVEALERAKAAEARVKELEAYAKLADADAASEENRASGLEARIAELDDELKGLVQENTRLENSLRNWREGAERVEKERAFWRTRAETTEAKLRETQDELAHEKGGRLDEAAIRSAVEKETGMWPYGRISDAVAECLRSQQAKWEAFVSVEAERAEKAEARVKELELEAQAKTDDAHALVVNDAHLKTVAALRGRVAWLEAQLAEAVAALRGLLRDEWYIYEGNLEASGHAAVDDLNAAHAVLAKYPEGR